MVQLGAELDQIGDARVAKVVSWKLEVHDIFDQVTFD